MHNRVARTMPIVFFPFVVYCHCGSQRTLFFSHLENDFFGCFFIQRWPDTFVTLHIYTHYGILRALFRFVRRLYFSSFDYIHTAAGPNESIAVYMPPTNDAISVAHMPADFSRRIISVSVNVHNFFFTSWVWARAQKKQYVLALLCSIPSRFCLFPSWW